VTLFDIKYDDFKREDTTNTIVITLYTDDRQPITPNASHTWKAKVSKGDKYVGEYPVTISDNTIKLSSSNLTRLPNGDYGLELWETYDGSTTIYPSAGVMEFRVHRNANDTLGTIDPTTDINAIIDDLHKAGQNIKVVATNTLPAESKASVTQSIANGENQLTFNIPQGDKGDKGDVGPAPTLKIGTVTKLGPDQAPTVALTGDNGAYTLNMGIPQGSKGDPGDNGFYHYAVDLTDAKYDRNKWYYVEADGWQLGSLEGPSYFSLDAPLNAAIVPYGDHTVNGNSKSACARQTVLYGQSGWGAYGRKLIVLDDQPAQWATDGKRLLTFAVPSDNNLNYAFYARGGLKINITSDVSELTWTPHTDELVVNDTTIPVLNDAPDPKVLGLDDDHTFWALPMHQLKQQLKPVKGTDYWTDADKNEILNETKSYVDEEILSGKW
jgi:hypothetical protein